MEIIFKSLDSLYYDFSKLSGRHSEIVIHFYNLIFLDWQTNRRWRMTSKDTAYLHSFRFSRQSQGRHIAGAFSPSPWQPPWPRWKGWWNRIRHGDLDKRDQSVLSSGVNCFWAKIRVGWVQYLLKQALFCPGLLFGRMVPIHASMFGGTHGSRAGAQMRQRRKTGCAFLCGVCMLSWVWMGFLRGNWSTHPKHAQQARTSCPNFA